MKLEELIKTGTTLAGLAFLFKSRIFQKILLVLFVSICALGFWIYMQVFYTPPSTFLSDNFGFHVSVEPPGRVVVSHVDPLFVVPVQKGDLIEDVNGTPVSTAAAVESAIQQSLQGQSPPKLTVSLRVRRNGQLQTPDLELDLCEGAGRVGDLGLTAKFYQWGPTSSPTSVVFIESVDPNSKAATAGLAPAQAITRVSGNLVRDLTDVTGELKRSATRSITLNCCRNAAVSALTLNDFYSDSTLGIDYDLNGSDWKIYQIANPNAPAARMGLVGGSTPDTIKADTSNPDVFNVEVKSPVARKGVHSYSNFLNVATHEKGNGINVSWVDPVGALASNLYSSPTFNILANDDIIKLNDSSSVTLESLVSQVKADGFVKLRVRQGGATVPVLFSIRSTPSITVENRIAEFIWVYRADLASLGYPSGSEYPLKISTTALIQVPSGASVTATSSLPFGTTLAIGNASQTKKNTYVITTNQPIVFDP